MGVEGRVDRPTESEFERGFRFGIQVSNFAIMGHAHNAAGENDRMIQTLLAIARGELSLIPTLPELYEGVKDEGVSDVPGETLQRLEMILREDRATEVQHAKTMLRAFIGWDESHETEGSN